MATQHGSRSSYGDQRDKKDREFDSKVLDLARVARVRAGGRRFSFRAVVVVGDKKGRVGVGIGKGVDVAQATEKATRGAKKELLRVVTKNETIPYSVEGKFGASRILLRPQQKGRGVVAGSSARVICELAGIKNISAKYLSRTHNKLNNAMATIEALKKLKARKVQKSVAEPAQEEVKPAVIEAQSQENAA